MKSNEMIRVLAAADEAGENLPAHTLLFYFRNGSIRVKEMLSDFVLLRSSVIRFLTVEERIEVLWEYLQVACRGWESHELMTRLRWCCGEVYENYSRCFVSFMNRVLALLETLLNEEVFDTAELDVFLRWSFTRVTPDYADRTRYTMSDRIYRMVLWAATG